jgi:hypothetical protein
MKNDDVDNLELEIFIFSRRLKTNPKLHLTKITVPLTEDAAIISAADKDGSFREFKKISSIAINKIVELAVPFQDLKANENDKLEFIISLKKKGLELERCPVRGNISISVPPEDYEYTVWPL